MGERGNICLSYPADHGSGEVWFYTHWRGDIMQEVVAVALHKGMGRWDDYNYLARIIFTTLVPAHEHDITTGFGISPYLSGEEENPTIFVNLGNNTVTSFFGANDVTLSYQEFIEAVMYTYKTNNIDNVYLVVGANRSGTPI